MLILKKNNWNTHSISVMILWLFMMEVPLHLLSLDNIVGSQFHQLNSPQQMSFYFIFKLMLFTHIMDSSLNTNHPVSNNFSIGQFQVCKLNKSFEFDLWTYIVLHNAQSSKFCLNPTKFPRIFSSWIRSHRVQSFV